MSQQLWHAKEPSLLDGHECRVLVKICLQPFTGNGKVSLEVKRKTQTNIAVERGQKGISRDLSLFFSKYIRFVHIKTLCQTEEKFSDSCHSSFLTDVSNQA